MPVTGEVTDEGIRISFDSQAGEIVYRGSVEEGVFKGTCDYGQLGTFEGEKQSGSTIRRLQE